MIERSMIERSIMSNTAEGSNNMKANIKTRTFVRNKDHLKMELGTTLVVQWVRLHAPNVGGPSSIPGRGTRSHMHAATKSLHARTKRSRMLQLKILCAARKIPSATIKTRHSQNK